MKNIISKIPKGANVKIMDLKIDVAVQVEYMRMLEKNGKASISDKAAATMQERLLNPDTKPYVKKNILQKLSQVDKVDVLRFLEQYADKTDSDLRQFAQLAAFHSQMNMEGALLGERPTVLLSGLGGKDKRLRYFVALIPTAAKRLSTSQKRIISEEFAEVSQDFNAEIENEIDFTGRYPRFTMLVPYLNDPNSVVAASIKSCNEVGIFLRNEAIISNVKELDDDEVNQVWHRIKQQRPPSPIQWQDTD